MPYEIRERNDEYCVYRTGEDDNIGCHQTETEARAQIEAIYANKGKAGPVVYVKSGGVITAHIDDVDVTGLPSEPEQHPLPETALEADSAFLGGGVKALGNGKIGGYLVVFGDAETKDLEGDYFTPETEFSWPVGEHRLCVYHHGMDDKLGKKRLAGPGVRLVKRDDIGLWVEAQMNLRDEWERAIYGLVEAGKLGWSSGTAGHMVEREPDGKILLWPVVEGSPTPQPAEPRAKAVPVKALQPAPLDELTAAPPDGAKQIRRQSPSVIVKEGKNMDMETLQAFVPELDEEQGRAVYSLMEYGDGKVPTIEQLVNVARLPPESADKVNKLLTLSYGNKPQPESNDGVMSDGEMEGGDKMGQYGKGGITPEQLEDALTRAMKAALGSQPQPSNPSPRPMYRQPEPMVDPEVKAQQDAKANRAKEVKTTYVARFGSDVDNATKSVLDEIYRADYREARLEHVKAFGLYLRYGEAHLSKEQHSLLKTMMIAPSQIEGSLRAGAYASQIKSDMREIVGNLGGFTVPAEFNERVIERLPGTTAIRPRATVQQTSSDTVQYVRVTGGDTRYVGAERASWVGDAPAAGASDTNATYALEQIPVHILMATVPFGRALIEDSSLDIVSNVQGRLALAFAIKEEDAFVQGLGLNNPEGILPGGTNTKGLTETVNGDQAAIDADRVIDTAYSIDDQYLPNAVWIMARQTALEVRKLKDGEGNYLWQPGIAQGEAGTLLGYPVVRTQAMPLIVDGSDTYPILFGDVGYAYTIVDRVGMTVIRDEITRKDQYMVEYTFSRRLGGQLVLSPAMSTLKMAVS